MVKSICGKDRNRRMTVKEIYGVSDKKCNKTDKICNQLGIFNLFIKSSL
jgi:hypothetical protein